MNGSASALSYLFNTGNYFRLNGGCHKLRNVAAIDRGIDRDTDGAPLPRNRSGATWIPSDVFPFRRDIGVVWQLGQIQGNRQTLFVEDRHIVGRGHHKVKAVATGLDLGQRSVVAVIVSHRHGDLSDIKRRTVDARCAHRQYGCIVN